MQQFALATALTTAVMLSAAVTNFIINSSFEQSSPGTEGFTGWTKSNAPASVIA